MTWTKGNPWRVVRSLDRLNTQIRAAYPRALPPATPVTSWGAIADDAHSSTSDHYPHYYAALGPTAVVCARDFPHAPSLGLDAHALADRLRQARDPRVGYIISNGRITGPSHDWKWERYTGSDPHDTHIHVSTVHTAAADGTSDWQIGPVAGEEDDMDQKDPLLHPIPGDPKADVGWALSDVSQAVATLFRKPGDPKVAQGMKAEPGSVLDRLLKAADRPPAQLTADQLNALGLQLSEAVTSGPLTVRLPDDQLNAIAERVADIQSQRLAS